MDVGSREKRWERLARVMPELTEPCDCRTWKNEHPTNCPWCNDTLRILLSGDLLLSAGRRVLGKQGWFIYYYFPSPAPGWHVFQRWDRGYRDQDEEGALLQALEGVWEEMRGKEEKKEREELGLEEQEEVEG